MRVFRRSARNDRLLLTRTAAAMAATLVMLPVTAGAGQAITGPVDANAYALQGSVRLLTAAQVTITRTAGVNSPGTGTPNPVTGGVASVNVPGAAATGAVTTSAGGDALADTATAAATVANLNVADLVTASTVAASCTTASPGGAPTASATVTGLGSGSALSGLGLTLGALPAGAAAPNTDVPVSLAGAVVGHLFLNTQTPASGTTTAGATRIASVDALHLVINASRSVAGVTTHVATVDVTVGHADCTTTVPTAATVSAINPVQGPQVGGTTVTIDGTDLTGTSAVIIGGTSAAFTRVSTTRVTAVTPAHAPGATTVQVVNATATTTASQQFTYLGTPTVTAITPSSGPAGGGTTVTLTGTGFTGATAVAFGSTAASGYTVVNPTTIVATAPAGTGTQFVTVTAPGGTSATGSGNAYSYYATPTLTSISPASGPTTGGTSVTLTGTGFTAGSVVKVDGVSQSVAYNSSTSLQITTPAHAAGGTGVTVTTPGGTTAASTFTYLAVPTATGLSPTSGTTSGGDTVTVTGTGLGSVTAVGVDGTNATISSKSSTSLSFTTPLHGLPGAVAVTLTGPGAITTSAGTYTYVLPGVPPAGAPTVTSLTPTTGPLSGGTSVQIQGTNLGSATAVAFGATPATGLTANTATSLTVTAPAASAAGPVSVTVTTASGTSAVTVPGTYVYQPLTPGLTSLSPSHGPDTGGTTTTLTGSGFTPASTVTLDQNTTLPSTYVSATRMSVILPAHAAGGVDIQVATGVLQSPLLRYTYDPTPTVTGMTPASGSTAGGQTVTITGTNLNTVSTVTIGGTTATPGGTASSLTFTTPAHAAGSVNVILSDAGNTFSTAAGTFLYLAPAPSITSISPTHGPLAGGNTVTVTGTGLGTVTGVTIGGANAPVSGGSTATSVTATVPASTAVGATTLVLSTPSGTATSTYTYDPAPTVTGVTPMQGPDNGGTTVTVTGTGFTGATAVKFAATSGTGLTVNSDTSITVTSPSHAPGQTDVTVVTPSGTSAVAQTARFTFIDTHVVPTVTGVTPNVGSTLGGTPVVITGTGFTGTTGVTFGGTATVVAPVGLTDTTITAVAPPHAAGPVAVVVTNATGPSTTNGAFTYVAPGAPPVVTGVSPASGPLAAGTPVIISGIGFTGVTTASFGGTAATGVTVVDDTTITATAPAHAAGAVDVTVSTGVLTSAATLLDVYSYMAVPTITTITPNTGPVGGGTSVTITGTGFSGATGVTFAGTAGTGLAVGSDTSLTVTTPAGTVGPAGVVVHGVGGNSGAGAFTYTPAAPSVTGVSPSTGKAGDTVTVTGTGFSTATTVTVGGTVITLPSPGVVTVQNDGSMTVVVPAHAAGQVDVVVGGPGGSSPIGADDRFTYAALPTVTAILPTSGPVAGGTTVQVTGTGFTGATSVSFGATPGTNVAVSTDTTLTVTSPAGSAGAAVDLRVTAPGGTSATGAGDVFTYNALPVITSVAPAHGPTTGGTPVLITGTGLGGVTAVLFDGISAPITVPAGSTTVTALSPPHAAGLVDIVVLGPNGASANLSTANDFTYDAPAAPATATMAPTNGPVAGGTTVTITGSGFAGATGVTFGGVPGTDVTVTTPLTLTVTTPAHAPGVVPVVVTGPGGSSGGNISFTYDPAPVVTSLTPATGTTAGGTTVTVAGTGFTGATAVRFGNISVTPSLVTPASVTVTSPARAAGTVDVTVVTPSGTSTGATATADDFVYTAAAPTITSMSPNTGTTAGGTVVSITGAGFTGATAVTFGTTTLTPNVVSDTSIVVTSPGTVAAGPVLVSVTTAAGTSAPATYTYTLPAAPAVTGITPTSGTVAGGQTVTFTGTGFTGVTGVLFGVNAATNVAVSNDTTMTVTTPAGAAALPVTVTVTGPGGTATTTYTYQSLPTPTIGSISPNTGPTTGGTSVTITGTNLLGAGSVTFGGTNATITAGTATSITVTSPLFGLPGAVDVTVTTPNGTVTSNLGFTYQLPPAPSVSTMTPASGPSAGGDTVTFTGTGFTGVSTVLFGLTTGSALTVSSDTSMTVTTPAHAAGANTVTVTGPGGIDATRTYTFVSPTPAITGVSPGTGPTTGGTSVTITGSNLTGATGVTFGGSAGTITAGTATSVTVTTPGFALPGAVDVAVTTPNGTGTALLGFTYHLPPAPVVATMTPTSGTTAGGDTVTFTGTGFTGVTTVVFGSTAGGNVTVPSDTSMTVTTPAHGVGATTVTVTGPGGIDATRTFTFATPAPAVGGVTPGSGPVAGGTVVTINGSGFTGATAVNFGGVPATGVTVNPAGTSITVTSPAGSAATVDVTVVTPAGTSATGPSDRFTYVGAPTVSTTTPSTGTTAGGTPVTLRGSGFTGAISLTIGGVTISSSNFTVVDDTTITFTTPAGAAGPATVTVTGPGGTSPGGPPFTYVAPGSAPVIGSVSPGAGPVAGGTTVTITGSGFTGATGVLFDGVAGTNLVVVNDSTITVTTPAGLNAAGGSVGVVVAGPNGSSAGGGGQTFTYAPLTDLPTVSSITPDVGPVAGGTRLTIRGTKFDQYTTVSFDGVAGTDVQLGPDVGASAFLRPAAVRAGHVLRAAFSSFLTVDSPAHAQGPVTVTVTNAAGAVSFVQSFTFIPVNTSTTLAVTVDTGSTTNIQAQGPDYVDLSVTACADPDRGTVQLATDRTACRYRAPGTPGADTFTMSVVDVLGQAASQVVKVTVVQAGGSGTGGGGGNENEGGGGSGGGSGTGGGGGNDSEGGGGSGSGTGAGAGNGSGGSGGLAFTGAPLLLVSGLVGGIVLVLVGSGILTGDRVRRRAGDRAAAGATATGPAPCGVDGPGTGGGAAAPGLIPWAYAPRNRAASDVPHRSEATGDDHRTGHDLA